MDNNVHPMTNSMHLPPGAQQEQLAAQQVAMHDQAMSQQRHIAAAQLAVESLRDSDDYTDDRLITRATAIEAFLASNSDTSTNASTDVLTS